ncbi:unnamed protein product [Effrenium voratum]|nr:unnamed protein product [Effrenium voratum]
MGCSGSTLSSPARAVKPFPGIAFIEQEFPVRMPCIPGDVLISGNLPREIVEKMAGYCKGWLYIEPEQDEWFMPEAIQDRGVSLKMVPFKPGKDTSTSALHKMYTAISQMPRPLMIQCSSANRAAIALLLWMAFCYGYSRASVNQLLQDLDLTTVKSEAKRWLENQLPEVGKVEPLISRSPEVTQLYDEVTSTLTYIVACPKTREALLIDPTHRKVQRDLEVLQGMGLCLKYVLNTHCLPERSATNSLLQQTQPELQTVISQASDVEADLQVSHGQRIPLGMLTLEVRGTPGHTAGCVSYVLCTRTASFAFTGNSLLIRGCGNTDHGDARQLYRSVHQQIFTLPGDTIVCPGHDAKGRSVSTVEEEKRFNRRLAKAEEEFVCRMEKRHCSSPHLVTATATTPDDEEDAIVHKRSCSCPDLGVKPTASIMREALSEVQKRFTETGLEDFTEIIYSSL